MTESNDDTTHEALLPASEMFESLTGAGINASNMTPSFPSIEEDSVFGEEQKLSPQIKLDDNKKETLKLSLPPPSTTESLYRFKPLPNGSSKVSTEESIRC